MCFTTDNYSFTCRAVIDIKKGEELTTNYLHYQYHFFGLYYRQTELCKSWHFKCACHRCKDFTESGLLCDALVCKKCELGRVLPLNMDQGSEWVCNTCCESMTHATFMECITYWWNIIEKTSRRDIKELIELLQKILQVFDKKHYYVLEVKRRIIENIGDFRETNFEDLQEEWLEKKVEFCRDHFEIQRDIAPGLSEYKAYISAHIAEPLYWLTKRRYISQKCGEDELSKNMEEIAQHLLMITKIWEHCKKLSPEKIKAENAKDLLEMVEKMYLQKKHVDIAKNTTREAIGFDPILSMAWQGC